MNQLVKALLIVIGTLSIALGVIGIIIPLLPTTPLLLLGAACYIRSSEKLYKLLLKNKWLGGYIEDFQKKKGITLKNKVISITALWLSMGISLYFSITTLWMSILLVIIAVSVSAFILSFRTL
ncbi:YbaN family protein [Bacillus marasmi]|uniref:YbaN family protein n=1 Tax=Bacillus marasmi TaxID=1926279 RepID=UPI0011CB2853|nr:YbaN family protein [Bacillus marasmi]